MGRGSGIAAAVGEWVRANEDTVTQWRRHIHAHPELSHEEVATTAFILEVLSEHGLNPVPFPGTGLYVDLGPGDGDRLAFRADIDALSVAEISGLEFASGTPGVSHACGHDVHATICMALACALAELDLDYGVRIIFQPAEEVMGGGAVDVIRWGGLQNLSLIHISEPTRRS